MRNEKAMKAKIPDKVIAGIENQYDVKPLNMKSASLNPGTTKVTIKSVTAKPTHLKRPKVIKFIGRSKMLIIGLSTKEVRVRTIPARRREYVPSAKTIPETASETRYRETVLIMKCLRIVFIYFIILKKFESALSRRDFRVYNLLRE